MRPGQTLNCKLGFFQPSRTCLKLGLTLEATPIIEVSSHAVYVLSNNCMAKDIHVPKASHLGWLISQAFHDIEAQEAKLNRTLHCNSCAHYMAVTAAILDRKLHRIMGASRT